MAEKSSIVYILRQAIGIISERPILDDLSDKRRQHVAAIISQFANIPYINSIAEELQLKGIEAIINHFPLSSAQDCLDLYERDEPKSETKTAPEETPNIPPELEALVAEYEEHLSEKNVNDGKVSSVAESVKRAREAMIIRERLSAIRKNRAALSYNPEDFNQAEDKRYEDLIVKIVNPKAGSHEAVMAPLNEVISQAVDSYINTYPDITEDQKKHLKELAPSVIDSTRYLALTEAIDIENHHDLVTAISLSIFKADDQYTTSISDIYVELDNNAAKHDRLNQDIAREQLKLSSLKTERFQAKDKPEMVDHYVSLISTTEATIAQKINQRDTIDIDLTPFTSKVEDYLSSTTQTVISGVKKPDGSQNLDFDTQSAAARKVLDEIHSKLSADKNIQRRIPPPEDPLRQAVDLEKNIRAELPQLGLNPHATNEAQQASILISDPKTQSKDLSGQTILLYSKGLTTAEFDKVISHAWSHQNDPNSSLGKLYKAHPELFGTIRQQLETIEKTDTPEAHIERVRTFANDPDNAQSALSLLSKNKAAYEEYLNLSKKLSSKEIVSWVKDKANQHTSLAKFYQANSRLFGKINTEFEKVKNSALAREIGKPIGRLTRSLNSINNRITSRLNKISGFFSRNHSTINTILDPFGSLKSYFGRQAGQFITGRLVPNLASSSIGKLLTKEGLKNTIKVLAKKDGARAAALAAKIAVKAGIRVSAQALAVVFGVATFGVGIIIYIGAEIFMQGIKILKKGLDWLSQAFYGEEFNFKTAARDAATGAAALFGVGATAFVGFVAVAGAIASSAVASALGIIIVSSFIGYFFYITSILAGPIVSTLAQLEAAPKSAVSGFCSGSTMNNDNLTCNEYNGITYCFPVNDISTVSYVTAHHDYPANDIMRVGDKPGQPDDIPLPLIAYVDGTVIWTSETEGLGGYAFIIAGIDGMFYYYAHNMCNFVSMGQLVKAGDILGGMDSSGNAQSTPEHVHFQISDQSDMTTVPENYPHFYAPWVDFCEKLNLCGPLNIEVYPEFQ